MINWQERYERARDKLKQDNSICKENRDLFETFFVYEERKLKRTNGLRQLDSNCCKTLYGFVCKFKNVNSWFNNKPFNQLTETDIERVYNGLEDGIIKRKDGKPFISLQDSYYSKILKSTFFEMAGKLDMTKKIIKYTERKDRQVKYITEDDFRKLVDKAYKAEYKLLFWLAFDIGENINTLLRLQKKDFIKQTNPDTNEPEYRVVLRKEILKRSRKARSELTNYKETVELLDEFLQKMKSDEEFLFDLTYSGSKLTLIRARDRAKTRCKPNGEPLTWKDLRSSMACDLLNKGWTTDEVNSRLGHRLSSKEIDKYVTHLAIDRHRPKRKVEEFKLSKLQRDLEEAKEREKLQARRVELLTIKLDSREDEQLEMKKQMEVWKENIRKELLQEARQVMRHEVINK